MRAVAVIATAFYKLSESETV